MERTIDPRREWEAELIEVHSKIDNARNILILMRKSGGDSPVIQMNIRHKEEQLRQLLEEEKHLTALLAGKPQEEEAAAPETDDGWRSAAQLPEKAGVYRVMRRAIGGRPDYEDKCTFAQGLWRNRAGTVLNSVVKWKEDDGE